MVVTTCLLVLLTANSSTRADILVARLGTSSYRAREDAARDLVGLGRYSLAPLRRGQSNPDLEIAERCKRLLPLAEVETARQRIARIHSVVIADPRSLVPCDEPLLRRFLAVTGDSRAARDLYLEIYRTHGKFLDAIEFADARAGGEAFWQYVDQVLMFPDGRTHVDLSSLTFNPEDLALFWFLSAHPDIRPAECRSIGRKDFPYYTPRHAENHLTGANASPVMRRLFVILMAGPRNIADRQADERMVKTGFHLAATARLKEVRPIALRTALDPKTTSSQPAALLALAQVGEPEDADRLADLISNDRVAYKPSPARDQDRACVIGDLALAASIRISGQKLADFGFADASQADPTDFRIYVFASADRRAAARKKWAEFVAVRTGSAGGKR